MEIDEKKINFYAGDDYIEYSYLTDKGLLTYQLQREELEQFYKNFSDLPESITLKEFIQRYSTIIYYAFLDEIKELIMEDL